MHEKYLGLILTVFVVGFSLFFVSGGSYAQKLTVQGDSIFAWDHC